MRILLCSHVFPPDVGGIETVSAILAEEFARLGAEVTVVTQTPGTNPSAGYQVMRRPSIAKVLKLGSKADVVFQNNISLRTLVPLLACRKPVVIAHQTWLTRTGGHRGWQDYLKLAALRGCHNIAISHSIASSLPAKSVVIGNPFDAREFAQLRPHSRTADIVFLGRLVSDKGCDLLLSALAILKAEGISPSASIIGDGPELPYLKRLAAQLGMGAQVTFLGTIREGRGLEVARHSIMAIPSRWAEPFGVVALEGIAAGCVLAASRAGGLPDAVGPCGLLFQNGDATQLAAALKQLLTNPGLRQELIRKGPDHLRQFEPETVARKYLAQFDALLSGDNSITQLPGSFTSST